jgi:hypothetical protein
MTERRRRKVWVHHVVVSVRSLETRLEVAEAQGLGPDQRAAAAGVRRLLDKARDAAKGVDPKPGPLLDWWGGALVESAYQNLHAAKVQMIDVYDDAELAAEIPEAAARAHQTLHRDDPRRHGTDRLGTRSLALQRAILRHTVEDSYDAMDRQHERLRSFRNIVLLTAMFIAVLVGITAAAVWANPSIMPLCFPADGQPGDPVLNCPTGSNVTSASSGDIFVVGLLGLLGGALAAAMSIRNLRGTSSPYDVPIALAWLKVPLGAFTAILGLVAIQGEFVPGLSSLDSQQQILAYALLLGFAQQVFTHSLDVRAQSLLEALPGKDAASPPSATATAIASAPEHPPVPRAAPAATPAQVGPSVPSQMTPSNGVAEIDLAEQVPDYQPPPVDLTADDNDVVQDDESVPAPNVPAGDHR